VTTTPLQPADAPAAQLLDVRAVAALLDCSPRHIYRMADAGQMPRPVRIGALVRWRRTTGDPTTGIEDWITAGCPSCRTAGGGR
jgi:predicted DNA-binding transcriptional regulator AlpA